MSNYFEDLEIGVVASLGSHMFQRDEILEFARRYDPQQFHLDEDAAKRGLFGALSASGWHTGSVWLRLMLDHRKREADLIAFCGERPARYGPSPGFEKLSWLKPVLVDDTITFTTRVIDKLDAGTRPEFGLVHWYNEGSNQRGEIAFSVVSKVFVERRRPLTR